MAQAASTVSDPADFGPAYSVAMTAYNAVEEQTDADPSITASGALSNPNVVAARSWDLADELPFGTVIAIETATSSSPSCGIEQVKPFIGYRVIADTMNARMRNKIDILLHADDRVMIGSRAISAARALGSCKDISVRVVGHIDVKKMPRTQAELAAIIGANDNVLAVAK